MKNVIVRNLPDEVHRAIRKRAVSHGRSAEAEIRAILAEAVLPPDRIKLGSTLLAIGRRMQLTDEEHAALNNRDRTPAEPFEFD